MGSSRSSSLVCLAVMVASATGCADEASVLFLDAQLITPAGDDPFTLGTYDQLRIVMAQQGEEALVDETVPLADDDFRVPLSFDANVRTRIRVELTRGSEVWRGAPPAFFPESAFTDQTWLLRMVMGRPSTCAVVSPFDGDTPRSGVAYLPAGAFVYHFGGTASTGPSRQVTYSDHLWITGGSELSALPEPAGRTQVVMVGLASSDLLPFAILLTELGGPWRYALFALSGAERASSITLYDGAGIASAMARRDEVGDVLIAGGRVDDAPVATLARIDGSAGVTLGALSAPRAGATAVGLATGALVVGGDRSAGAPFAEWVDFASFATTPVDDVGAEPVRLEPLVVQGERSLWVIGGSDGAGAPVTTSWVVRGCPEACALEAGPALELGVGASLRGDVLVDGARVSRVSEEGGWHLSPVAELVHPRQGAGVTAYESGIVWVHGGAGIDGPRGDAELCWPAQLTPLP